MPLSVEPYGIHRGVVAIIVEGPSEAALGSLDLIEAVADMYSLVAMVSPSRPPILPEHAYVELCTPTLRVLRMTNSM